jgi:hypothetical protein
VKHTEWASSLDCQCECGNILVVKHYESYGEWVSVVVVPEGRKLVSVLGWHRE